MAGIAKGGLVWAEMEGGTAEEEEEEEEEDKE